MTKRHAKPTSMQLAERTYRKVLFIEKVLADAAVIHADNKTEIEAIGMRMASIVSTQKRISETVRTLADHCARLLREKETLQRQLAIEVGKSYKVVEDSEMTIHSHPPGMLCTDGCRTFPTRPQL